MCLCLCALFDKVAQLSSHHTHYYIPRQHTELAPYQRIELCAICFCCMCVCVPCLLCALSLLLISINLFFAPSHKFCAVLKHFSSRCYKQIKLLILLFASKHNDSYFSDFPHVPISCKILAVSTRFHRKSMFRSTIHFFVCLVLFCRVLRKSSNKFLEKYK